MKRRQSAFDFSEARKPFDEGRKNDIHPADNVAAWKSMPDFPAFAAWYFSTILYEALHHHYRDATGYPIVAGLTKTFTFWNPNFFTNQSQPKRNGSIYQRLAVPKYHVRTQNTFSLNFEEAYDAEKFLRQNPRFTLAMVAFQSCVVNYIQQLHLELGISTDEKSFGQLTRNNAGVGSIVNEMGLLMAENLSHEETPFTSKSLGKALCNVFRRQAFKSVEITKATYNECPYAHGLAQALQISFTENAGKLHAREGQGHGAMLLFLMEYLPKKFPRLEKTLAANASITDQSFDV